MYPPIPWELVADLLVSAGHTLETTATGVLETINGMYNIIIQNAQQLERAKLDITIL